MEINRSKEKYATFCARLTDMPICCYPWYLDAVAEDGEWAVVMVEEAGRTLAAWPYFYKQRWGMKYVPMPLFTKHLGILPAPSMRAQPNVEALQLLLNAMPRFAGFDQQFHPVANEWVSALPASYEITPHYLHRLHLNSDKNWRAGINRNMRRNIRKADAQLSLSTDLDLETFYRINTLSFTRQAIATPYSLAQLRQHDRALAQANRRQLFAAVDAEENIHSVAYLMWDDHSAYYHLSGDDPALRKSGSGIWLIAQALDFTQQQLGLPVFDFEGSMIPAVAAIREQFGAARTTYYRVQHARSWVYRVAKRWRERM